MKQVSILCLAMMFVISCTKEEPMEEAPVVPPKESLDLNSDGVIDFEIRYSPFVIDGAGFSRYGYFARLKPLDQNQILLMEDSAALDIVVQKVPGDTLRVTSPDSEKWLNQSIEIISITSHTETTWPDKWKINVPFSSSKPAYIGIKINKPNVSIGWMLLQPSESTGKISLIKSETSSSELLVIDPS